MACSGLRAQFMWASCFDSGGFVTGTGVSKTAAPPAATTSALHPKCELNTTSNSAPDPEMIEVIDPVHPLFSRTFQLVSRHCSGRDNASCVLVAYRDSVLIKLPVAATNLSSAILPAARTKLNAEAIQQLLAFVKECEQPCRPNPKPSGAKCRKRSGNRSSKTSSPSSRR